MTDAIETLEAKAKPCGDFIEVAFISFWFGSRTFNRKQQT